MKSLRPFIILFSLLITLKSIAKNYYTNASGTWNTNANWVGGSSGKPGNGTGFYTTSNDTIFVNHALTTANNFDLGSSTLVVIIGSTGSLTLSSSKDLNLNGTKLTLNGGSLTVPGNFTTSNPSSITLNSGATIAVTGNVTLNSTILNINQGTTFSMANFSTSNTQGTINIAGTMNVNGKISQSNADWTIKPTGILNVTGDFINDNGNMDFVVQGKVNIGGNVEFHSGNYTIASGGNFKATGTDVLTGNAVISNNGTMSFPNLTTVTNWGTPNGWDCNGSTGAGIVYFPSSIGCAAACSGSGSSGSGSGGCNSIALPIELGTFEVKLEGSHLHFIWLTYMEKNNAFFTIEYSEDLTEFTELFQVKGAGNSSTIQSYQENYPTFAFNNVLYFRLKQTDYDGTFTYSPLIFLSPEAILSVQPYIYPNPANDKILIQSKETSTKTVTIFSSFSHQILGEYNLVDGAVTVDVSGYEEGIYFIRLDGKNYKFLIKH